MNHCRALGTAERIDAYYEQLDAEGNDFAPASICWLRSRDDVPRYIAKMEDLSSFGDVHAALEKFARKAHYIQLMSFVENIEREYRRQKSTFSELLHVTKENLRDPAALERAIHEKKDEVDEVYGKINRDVDTIYNEYLNSIDNNGKIQRCANELKRQYTEQLKKISNLPAYAINPQTIMQLKKMTFDIIEDSQKLRSSLAQQFLKECNERLTYYTDDPDSIQAEVYCPNFTEADFDKINQMAVENAHGYKEITSFLTLTEKKRIFSSAKYVAIIEQSIRSRLDSEIVPVMMTNIVKYIQKCRDLYVEKLTENKRSLEQEYDELLRDKENNEKRERDIARLEQNLYLIAEEQTKTTELKGVIANYVDAR